jgi:hypothetical protein
MLEFAVLSRVTQGNIATSKAPAEPIASFGSASAGGMHYGLPADADLLVATGSAVASPSRKSITALPCD